MSLKEILEKPGRHYDSGHRCDYRVTVEAALQHLAATPSLPVTDGVWDLLRKTAYWTRGDGSPCWCAESHIQTSPEQHVEFCQRARAALATRGSGPATENFAENLALSLEAGGFGDGGKLCTPLSRYRDAFPRGHALAAPPLPESPWKGMDSAPKDGRLVELNVIFEEHPFEDDDEAPQQTIGLNNFDNDEVDAWKFAGWCWNDDHFTEGKGKPVGWRPFVRPAAPDSPKGGEDAKA